MLVIYLIIGAFAGTMAGLFGIGGGVVIIPALMTIFEHSSLIPPVYSMQMAVGTSLAIVVVTGAVSLYVHHLHAAVVWSYVQKIVPGLIVGVIIGSALVRYLPSNVLRIIFGFFLVIVASRLLFNKSFSEKSHTLSKTTIQFGAIGIGALSSLLGVAGGIFLLPFLLRMGLAMHKATGTSVACGFIVGSAATLSFMFTGLVAGIHLPGSTGYIYWPAFVGIASASVLFAPVGAILSHKLSGHKLKKMFGFLLLVMAIDLLFF